MGSGSTRDVYLIGRYTQPMSNGTLLPMKEKLQKQKGYETI